MSQTESNNSATVTLTVTPDQAVAIAQALDTYTRLSIGQLEAVTELIRYGEVPCHADDDKTDRLFVESDAMERIEAAIIQAKADLGFHPNHSLSIVHGRVPLHGRRTYEVLRVLEKALAEFNNPSPEFPGASYDGLKLRCTDDPAPVVTAQAAVATE